MFHGLVVALREDSELGKSDLMPPFALSSVAMLFPTMPLHHAALVKHLPHLLLCQRLGWRSPLLIDGDGLIKCRGIPPELGLPIQLAP